MAWGSLGQDVAFMGLCLGYCVNAFIGERLLTIFSLVYGGKGALGSGIYSDLIAFA